MIREIIETASLILAIAIFTLAVIFCSALFILLTRGSL